MRTLYFFSSPIIVLESTRELIRIQTNSGHCLVIPVLVILISTSPQPLSVKLALVLLGVLLWTYKVRWFFDLEQDITRVERSVLGWTYQRTSWILGRIVKLEIRRVGRGDGFFDFQLELIASTSEVLRVARRGRCDLLMKLVRLISPYLPPSIHFEVDPECSRGIQNLFQS